MNSRQAGLKRQSDALFLDAGRAPAAPTFQPGKVHWAYLSGYLALLSAVSAKEVRPIADHPHAEAALLGAKRLGLDLRDRAFAQSLATNYYNPTGMNEPFLFEVLAWARRARTAAGW